MRGTERELPATGRTAGDSRDFLLPSGRNLSGARNGSGNGCRISVCDPLEEQGGAGHGSPASEFRGRAPGPGSPGPGRGPPVSGGGKPSAGGGLKPRGGSRGSGTGRRRLPRPSRQQVPGGPAASRQAACPCPGAFTPGGMSLPRRLHVRRHIHTHGAFATGGVSLPPAPARSEACRCLPRLHGWRHVPAPASADRRAADRYATCPHDDVIFYKN
jgi:hypothetical protein